MYFKDSGRALRPYFDAHIRPNLNLSSSPSLAINFLHIRGLYCLKNIRMDHFSKDLYVGHDTMASYDAREILYRWEEWNLIVDRDDFIIILSQLIAVAFDFLRPCDNQSEVGRLRQLREFSRFGRRQTPASSYQPIRSVAQLSLRMRYRPHPQTCHNEEDLLPCACVFRVQDY